MVGCNKLAFFTCIVATFFILTCLLGDSVGTKQQQDQTSVDDSQKFPDYFDDPHDMPYFDNSTNKIVTVEPHQTVYLHCIVKRIGSKSVSWIRQRDYHILTVGTLRYTGEVRFNALPQKETGDWVLQIKYAQPKDSGVYECQVGTDPKISQEVFLKIEEATATIRGGSSLHVQVGSTVVITCEVSSPSVFVLWYHNGSKIVSNPDSRYEIIKVTGSPTISTLKFKYARPSDAGHYSCDPSNAKPENMTLHVVEGEKASPMLRDRNCASSKYFQVHFLCFTLFLIHKITIFCIR